MDEYIKKSEALKAIRENRSKMAIYTVKAICAIEDLPSADVVPKSEVEELIRENESLAKTVNEASSLIRKLRNKVEKSQTEVAREIFAEIEKVAFTYYIDKETDKAYRAVELAFIAELKKKYTEREK